MEWDQVAGSMAVGIIRLALFVAVAWVPWASAVDTEILPAHISMAQMKAGSIEGLDQVWAGNGRLYDLGQSRSVSFDGYTLSRVSPEARELVNALNQVGSRNLGDKINMGTLNIHTLPEVSYFAPVYAYGLNERWTLGVGIPVIRYANRISLDASASNLSFYQQQLGGNSQLIDQALNIDLVAKTREVLASKGFKTLESRDQTFMGDIQLAALHRLKDIGSWQALHQINVTLPTGPKDDPDDLMAINGFARTSVENSLVVSRALNARWTVLPYTSFLLPLPDRVVKRTPLNEDDVLPEASTKQSVWRFTSPSFALGSELRWAMYGGWQMKGGMEGCVKARDRYDGQGRVDLLSRGSDFTVARVRAGFSYSSIDEFKAGRAMLPSRLAVDISDTVYGRNIERQMRTDVSAMLFF